MRVAAIDVGTNTVLMLVAERATPTDELRALEDHAEITRLGAGVDRTKRLDEGAIERTLEVLSRYATRATELGVSRLAAVATSAARDASNGSSFRARAKELLGVEPTIASGDREAALTYRGALGGLGISRDATVAVIDVGGGSTELVIGARGVIEWAHSYDVGSVRLTERHVRNDPPTSSELAAIEQDARAIFGSPSVPLRTFDAIVAIAGTATTYAAIDRELVRYADAPPHGHRMSHATLARHVDALARKPLARRGETIGLDPRRADVIVAGGIVLTAALEALRGDEIVVSDRGVRWGLAEELAQ